MPRQLPCLLWFVLLLLPLAACVQAETIPKAWGKRWQPVLPKQERHPFLFFDDGDKARMQKRIQVSPYSLWWESLKTHRVSNTPAFIWWMTGDEVEAKKCRDALLESPIWRQKPQGYLETSCHSFADYVVAYDFLASWKGLDPASNAAIRRKIAEEADHYYEEMETVGGGKNHGNQRTLAASALGMAALTLCDYKESRHTPKEWLTRALYSIRREENLWFFRPGGLFVEGVGYSDYMNVQFMPFAIAFERVSGQFLFDEPLLREWLEFAAYQTQPNGTPIPWGTCEMIDDKLDFYIPLANQRYGKKQAALFQHMANTGPPDSIHPYHIYIAIAQYDPQSTASLPPASRSFGASQTVVMRSNWGRESVNLWFAGKDGSWPVTDAYRTYSQADTGHFVMIAWDEILASDSGYDHWHSQDYYGAEFHNVPLIDGKGPTQTTFGTISGTKLTGPVQHATMTAAYQDCLWNRTLFLVRGRYALVVDAFRSSKEHEFQWQIRSSTPPGSRGSSQTQRSVTWPGLSSKQWQKGVLGERELTTVFPPFAQITVEKGRWRPLSGEPEFANQVAVGKWRGGSHTALFALLPNQSARREVTWEALDQQNLRIRGPHWTDTVRLDGDRLVIHSSDTGRKTSIRLLNQRSSRPPQNPLSGVRRGTDKPYGNGHTRRG